MIDGETRNRDALSRLREERKAQVKAVQSLLKDQIKTTGEITRLLKDGPRTVPSLAETTGLPTQTVFWHLMALKKYGKVAEGDLDDEYYQYRLVE